VTPPSAARSGTGAPVRVFVAATGNEFMRDIASWIVDASRASGRTAELVTDELPQLDGSINLVVAPHEFFELFDASTRTLQRAAAVSICVATEQPGTPWFDLTLDACRRGLECLDINPHGVRALRSAGVDAAHLQLGAVPAMAAARATDRALSERPIDVLFMGGLDDRRGAALAELAPTLQHLRSDLRLFKFDRPVDKTSPGVVFGDDKYRLLASAKILVNLHRNRGRADTPAYFEWARMIEAMANRCVVITEPSETSAPLMAGEHFLSVPISDMGTAITRLLSDPVTHRRLADDAFHAVSEDIGFAGTLATVLDHLETVTLPRITGHLATSDPASGPWRLGASKIAPPVRLGPFRPHAELQRAAKKIALDDTAMLRRIDSMSCMLRHGDVQHVERVATPAYDRRAAAPRVSAIVTLYDYAEVVTDTLASLVSSVDIDYEVVVVDDHSTDDGRRIVTDFFEAHPHIPMLLLGKDANEGLAAARNDAFAAAHGEYVFVIDADNQVYPRCLTRLADTLDSDPGAAATYSILEDFGDQRNIRSALAWDPVRLCSANYIDAQAMWRRTMWTDLGGYRDDDREVYGWEDWDLWLRLAAAGGRAVLHPEILGRYRVQASSMITLTNLATDDAIASVHRRYPTLPWPGATPLPGPR